MTNSRLFKICFAIFWWVSKPRDLNRKGGEEEKEFFRHPRRISGPRPVWTGSSYGKHALGRIGRMYARRDVRFWHNADIRGHSTDVRFWG
jgi:hypothetical protein